MPVKKRKTAVKRKTPGKKRPQRGGMVGLRSHMLMHPGLQNGTGFFGDIWDGIKSVGNFVKDNKILSTVSGLIPHAGAQGASKILGQIGLGKKRHVRKNVLKF